MERNGDCGEVFFCSKLWQVDLTRQSGLSSRIEMLY
jgi:hypothetical protein